jgi:hypothetical protein
VAAVVGWCSAVVDASVGWCSAPKEVRYDGNPAKTVGVFRLLSNLSIRLFTVSSCVSLVWQRLSEVSM